MQEQVGARPPPGVVDVEDAPGRRPAGVEDQDAELAVTGLDVGDQARGGRGIGEVGDDGGDLPPGERGELGRRVAQPLLSAAGEDDVEPGAGEPLGAGASDARPAAADERRGDLDVDLPVRGRFPTRLPARSGRGKR